EGDLVVASILSGNRNFEGRVHALVRANYLASPMLVVAYALIGNINADLSKEPLGFDKNDEPIYLSDIWPTPKDVAAAVRKCVTPSMFRSRYADVFSGGKEWKKIKLSADETYRWDDTSTYVKRPPYFEKIADAPGSLADLSKARILGLFGDSITTD